jgi:F420-dependent oxidoreductase-like protein
MKIGLQVNRFDWPGGTASIGGTLAEIARAADEAGFASLWVMDHMFQIAGLGPPEAPMLECYSALSYVAGFTQRLRLGAMVGAVVYRQPGLLAKTVSTLDVLSGGRANLGIGAAWYDGEAAGLGLPFPPLKERFERLEETLQIVRRMWAGDRSPFVGKHYQLAEPIISPPPLSKPHPPILIGGGGEQRTLRLVAQYADACNLFTRLGVGAVSAKLEVLKRHCEAVGRPYEDIERTGLGREDLGPDGLDFAGLLAKCRELAGVGIQQYIFSVPNVYEIKPLETIGREVIPAVAPL